MIFPTTNALQSTAAILRSLAAKCAAVQWQGQPAFDRVEIFDVVDLRQMIARLALNQPRFCALIYAGDDFTAERRGLQLQVRSRHEVACLIGDRVIGDPVEAYMGSDTTPGAYELARLVAGAVTGEVLPHPDGCYCVPLRAEALVIEAEGAKLPGRSVMELDLEITGGELHASVGAGPVG